VPDESGGQVSRIVKLDGTVEKLSRIPQSTQRRGPWPSGLSVLVVVLFWGRLQSVDDSVHQRLALWRDTRVVTPKVMSVTLLRDETEAVFKRSIAVAKSSR
jgi:hypothetical protein